MIVPATLNDIRDLFAAVRGHFHPLKNLFPLYDQNRFLFLFKKPHQRRPQNLISVFFRPVHCSTALFYFRFLLVHVTQVRDSAIDFNCGLNQNLRKLARFGSHFCQLVEHHTGGGGIEVCRRVVEGGNGTSVLILTSFDEDDEVFGVLAAGAAGYILKDTRPERVVHAVRSVADGQAVFDSNVAGRIISGRQQPGAVDGTDALSERELEVLQLMAKGFSNKEIGRALWIGETTVKTHVSNILGKLQVGDRTQAAIYALKKGLSST